MIVVDTSVFIDLFFEFDPERTKKVERLFEIIERNGISIVEPALFKVELASQLSRRMKKSEASIVLDETMRRVELISTEDLMETAFIVAFETGARAADSFYIATAKKNDAVLISNDKKQVESAKSFDTRAFYLLDEIEEAIKTVGG
ncbi:type II toxin-antitoxin system VapC family toxin [Thermococcus sp. Bubb.Bath]|uniref:type II toxin-antitoxin system VapC family toxin n=1 Tax=Thermococcus sp. Bubb.Bath TaxID=1638242 RepID=UPI00143B4AA0|nr:type II toxin-antitoxin system VapC family toxin [Thermococcus sp. Bubb.Bath]NJF25180.1 PIN domain-containing protein [Thermococcus sp. Bubb.Bath]